MRIVRYISILLLAAFLAVCCGGPGTVPDDPTPSEKPQPDPQPDPEPEPDPDPEPDPEPTFVEEPDDLSPDQNLSFDYAVLARAGHPRLMLSEEGFTDLKRRMGTDKLSNVTLCKIHHVIIVKAEACLKAAALSDPSAHENNVAELLALAYSWRVTGRAAFLEKIRRDLGNILKWKTLGSSDLAVGEHALALAITYDWLYYELSYEERTGLHRLLMDRAVVPSQNASFRGFYGNWNQVGNGGIMSAALALYEKDKARCVTNIETGLVDNKRVLRKIMAGGGGYPEGAAYWNYGMTYQAALLQSLLGIFGHTAGILDIEGLMDSGRYALMVHGSVNSTFAYADGGTTGDSHLLASWWYAAQKGDPTLAYAENHLLDAGKYESDYSRLMPLIPALLQSFNPDPVLTSTPDLGVWHCDGEMPLCIVRRGWTFTAADTYLGIKGGNCNTWKTMATSHGHMDAGSFVFESDGVKWSDDITRPAYSSWFDALERAGSRSGDTSQSGLRWSTFNVNALCHSTIVSYTNDGTVAGKLHPSDQFVDGHATFTAIRDEAGAQGAVLDMGAPMKGQVRSATRSITLLGDGTLEVQDRIEALPDRDCVLEWRMNSACKTTLSADGITLQAWSSSSKKRKLSAACSDDSVTLTYKSWTPGIPADWTGFTYYQTINNHTIAGWKATVPAGKTVTFTTILEKI